MKPIFFTPGPTQLYPTVKKHIYQALQNNILSISHRSLPYQIIHEHTVNQLKTLLGIPKDYLVFFVSSGTEAMERTIQNTVEKKSVHFVNGAFSQRFFTIAKELGKNAHAITIPWGQGFIPDNVNIPKKSELICITHNETSTGVSIPTEYIYKLKQRWPNVLLAIDMVSSAPYVDMDYTYTDIAFFSVQKGFGLPAGLGVLFVSPQAYEKSQYLFKKGVSIGSFHSFSSLNKEAEKHQTPETPNVLGIYLLGRVCEDMHMYGIKRIRKETEEKATLLYDCLTTSTRLKPFVKEKHYQSQTVIVAEVKNGSQHLLSYLKKKGMIVGAGYGLFKDNQIRIANFPAHTIKDIQKLQKTLYIF